ncbi:MAG: FliM/FliN family flagellar motor switch protein [Burkholderiales bacterium]|nr:FliM/FliN family flagellar motor switch protein [Burkholderiales bacterium]
MTSTLDNESAENQVQAQLIGLPELQPQKTSGPALLGGNTALLDGVKVNLSVVLGSAQTSLGELMQLQEAAVLKVDRTVDSPVDLVLNGNVVARGQLVAVDEHFGVRITEIAQSSKS